jgi:hypothetical protein
MLTLIMMSSNLMAKDDFKNLGFQDPKKLESEKGEKGELRW